MPNLPPILNTRLVAASILGLPPVNLPNEIPYDGKDPLFCKLTPSGNRLNIAVDSHRPTRMDPMPMGSVTSAVTVVSYAGNSTTTAPQVITYGGGPFKFFLRLDASLTRATVFLTEVSSAAAPAATQSTGPAAPADPPKGLVQFLVISDGDDPNQPVSIVFIEDRVVVPDYLKFTSAEILFGPPAKDGGGEFGPMAFRIDP